MPTVPRSGSYRFYFYSHEPHEPPHVHVDRDDLSAKFWLDPVRLALNFGFHQPQIRVFLLHSCCATAPPIFRWLG